MPDHDLSLFDDAPAAPAPSTADGVTLIEITAPEPCEGQLAFLDEDEWWQTEWTGMPEFVQEDQAPYKTLPVSFRTREDYQAFARLIGYTLTFESRYAWYPPMPKNDFTHMRYVDES